jgi:hypothetical protein
LISGSENFIWEIIIYKKHVKLGIKWQNTERMKILSLIIKIKDIWIWATHSDQMNNEISMIFYLSWIANFSNKGMKVLL